MSVGSICTREVDVAAPDETAQVAASRMNARNVGTLVVINAHRTPVGIVTDRDLAMRVVSRGLDPAIVKLDSIMSPLPETVTEDTPIESAIAIMRRAGHRRLPVVDEDDALLGLITLDDVLALLSDELGEIGELIRKEGPGALASRY